MRSRTYSWNDPAQTLAGLAGRSGREFLDAMAAGEVPSPPFASTLNFPGFSHIDEGYVEAHIPIQEYHYNPLGMVHGGVLATLLDTCAGCAVQTRLPEGVGYASIDLTIKFLRQVRIPDAPLQARGQILHLGRRVATATASVFTSEGKLAATALSSCSIIGQG